MGEVFYDVGTGIAVPGLEAIIEYGDADRIVRDRIPGAMLVNDRSGMECVRVTNIDGLHGDPEGRDTRSPKSDRDGEDAGDMKYGGRTIGLTGQVEAGSIPAVRDLTTRFFSQFGKSERDLIIHPPREVKCLVNEVRSPEPGEFLGAFGSEIMPTPPFWAASASVTATLGVGGAGTPGAEEIFGVRASVTGATAAGDGSIMRVYPTDELGGESLVEWAGEDIYIAALVDVLSASGTVASIDLVLRDFDTGVDLVMADTRAAPITGKYYWLAGRLAASSITRTTRLLGMAVRLMAPSGDYVMVVTRAMLVKLDESDPTPVGYFSGELPGYEYEDKPRASRSFGPVYAVNQIADPQVLQDDDAGVALGWLRYTGSGIVGTPDVLVSPRGLPGSASGRSFYFKVQKDSGVGTASVKMSARPARIGGLPWTLRALVSEGRSYRWSALVQVLQQPPEGTFFFVEWYNAVSSLLSTSSSAAIVTPGSAGYYASGTFTAPALAVKALAAIGTPGTIGVGSTLEIVVSDPCFVDITDVDVGDFCGAGQAYEETLQIGPYVNRRSISTDPTSLSYGARRRIPRPFLVRSVRKTSDAKASEQQQDRRYQRAFTMSLRAADPRLYVLDEHRAETRLQGSSQQLALLMPVDFSLNVGSLPVPTSWTYEGQFVTHPGTGTAYNWSHDPFNFPLLGGTHRGMVSNGVRVKTWDSGGSHGTNRPAQDLIARMYRSGEGYTYTSPRVVMGCSPQSTGSGFSTGNNSRMAYYSDLTAVLSYANNVTVLLKRVSSTAWLELRWYSMSVAASGGGPNPHAAFELWCSHNTSGTLSTTRLAQWDYASYNSASGNLPFDPVDDQMYLVSYMINEVVYWELWLGYPSVTSTANRLEASSYIIPAPMQSIIGTSVAGSVGMSLGISKTASQSAFNGLSNTPPFVSYFESANADVPAQSSTCTVIGSIDTPQTIELRGDVLNPIIQVDVPAYDDKPQASSVARFIGLIQDSAPIYVDLFDGSVRDEFGNNRRDLLIAGSKFEMLRPGVNQVSIQAANWGNYPVHMITSWRDALR